MKYLFFYKYSTIHGGIPVIMRHLGRGLLQANAQNSVTIVTEHTDYQQNRSTQENGFSIYYLDKRRVFSILFKNKYDVLCVYEPYLRYIFLTLLFKLLHPRLRTFLVFCGTRAERPGKSVKRLYPVIARLFTQLIAVSEYTKRVALGGKYPDRISVIYNPIRTEEYKQSTLERPALITIGRICPRKNYEDLMRMFHEVHLINPKLRLDVIGGHEYIHQAYYQSITKLIHSLDLQNHVALHGDVSEQKKIEMLSNSQIYVTASKHEMFGITTVEAMASGLPIIAFANTATEEVVLAAQNILVPDGDYKTMAREVLKLSGDPARMASLSSKSLAASRKFSYDHFFTSYQYLFAR